MNWAKLLSSTFFFCFPPILIAKKKEGTCCHFIDDVRVRACAEAGLKDRFFFNLCLNF